MPPHTIIPKNDRRRSQRGAARRPIRFFDPNSAKVHTGVLINGSNGGAFIETDETLPLLTQVRIEGPGILCHAEVCRVHWVGPGERHERTPGMAVRMLPGQDAIADADFETMDGPVLSLRARTAAGN